MEERVKEIIFETNIQKEYENKLANMHT